MVTCTGKPLTHGKLLLKLLRAILLPIQLAVCKCSAHTNAKDIVSKENTFADKTAKEAAEKTTDVFTLEEDKQPVPATFLKDMQMHSSKTDITSNRRTGSTFLPQGSPSYQKICLNGQQ